MKSYEPEESKKTEVISVCVFSAACSIALPIRLINRRNINEKVSQQIVHLLNNIFQNIGVRVYKQSWKNLLEFKDSLLLNFKSKSSVRIKQNNSYLQAEPSINPRESYDKQLGSRKMNEDRFNK